MKKILTLTLAAAFAAPAFAAGDVLVFSTDGSYPPFSETGSDG